LICFAILAICSMVVIVLRREPSSASLEGRRRVLWSSFETALTRLFRMNV
jgi:hypothetical protein